jgi:hypothetical protein
VVDDMGSVSARRLAGAHLVVASIEKSLVLVPPVASNRLRASTLERSMSCSLAGEDRKLDYSRKKRTVNMAV